MVLWTDFLALAILTVMSLIVLRIAGRQKQVHQLLFRIHQNSVHLRQVQMYRRIELALKILLPTVWILLLIVLVQ